VASDEVGSNELHTILNSGPSRPCLILTQRRVGERGFKETLIQLLERHFEKIVFRPHPLGRVDGGMIDETDRGYPQFLLTIPPRRTIFLKLILTASVVVSVKTLQWSSLI
jgi:hypothetical protein